MQYKVSELAQKTGTTKRTIHYYISKGLLLPPFGSGVNSYYDESHVERILLIKKLQQAYMPLNKIRDYILENPTEKVSIKSEKTQSIDVENEDLNNVYVNENVCNLFGIHCSLENRKKYSHIIENVKKYVAKMMED